MTDSITLMNYKHFEIRKKNTNNNPIQVIDEYEELTITQRQKYFFDLHHNDHSNNQIN